MSPLIAHFGSGNSLYTGILLVVVGMAWEIVGPSDRFWQRLGARIVVVLGAAGIVGSSIPRSPGILILWAASFLAWRVTSNQQHRWAWARNRLPWVRIVFLAITAVVLVFEIPRIHNPEPLSTKPESIRVVGDSLTAGTFQLSPAERWPAIFEANTGIKINLIARPGWRLGDAASYLKYHPADGHPGATVLLIGGNDVLGETGLTSFQDHLEQVLKQLANDPNGPVYMMELPLPPLSHQYGRIQRTVADRHKVRLIPKYHLMSVLTGEENTLDGIHLSRRGHRQLAKRLEAILFR